MSHTEQHSSKETQHAKASPKEFVRAVAQASLAHWITVLSLIIGGCCSNVYFLEKIVQ
jgi:hypothetical protein